MINQTGYRVNRHRTSANIFEIEISDKLILDRGLYCESPVNIGFGLLDPLRAENRKSIILVSVMPNVQRLRISRTKSARSSCRLIPILCPCFLITKNFLILRRCRSSLSIDFFVQYRLFSDIRKHRPIVIETLTARPHFLESLLISVFRSHTCKTDDKSVLGKRFGKARASIGSQ